MPTEVNWQPFLFTVWVFLAFIGLCGVAVVSDLWAKGSRKAKVRRREPVEWLNGEQVYLN